MGYSNKTLIQVVLAQALTGGTPDNTGTLVPLIDIGNTLESNLIPDSVVDQYIRWADEEINSALNEMYSTPICELADFESYLYVNIDEYNAYIVLPGACPLNVGDSIILKDDSYQERTVVTEIIDNINKNIFAVSPAITYPFQANTTRVLRVKYPDPIPLISALLSAARIYDKYFASQTDPNTSEYGKYLIKRARAGLNNILNGRTILHGVRRIGNRFYNSTLNDQYALPKGNDPNKDIDELG